MTTSKVTSEPLISYPEMATPLVTPDGLVSWGGVAMPATRVYPKIPGMIFDAPGPGMYPVGNGPAGRGCLDLWIVVGAVGLSRDVCSLVDSTGTTEIKVEVDGSNRPFMTVRDSGATSVALFAPSGAAYASGARLHVRASWNSASPLLGIYHVDLTVNGVAIAGAWVGGTTPWTPFVGTALSVAGRGTTPFAGTAFNGTVEIVQLGLL